VDQCDPVLRTDTISLHRLVPQVAAARRENDARARSTKRRTARIIPTPIAGGATWPRRPVATGRPAEALGLAQAALAAHESALGSDDAWTKDSARVTADALAALGRADDAKALRARYGVGPDGN
jgi:hypothetical protein